MSKLFISYSRYNVEAVQILAADLEAVAHDAWYDSALTGGQRWWNSILANIEKADIFVFALTKDSLESTACRSELKYAFELNKRILPVLLADDVNLGLLPKALSEFQVVKYLRDDKHSLAALIKAIHNIPPAGALPETPPVRPEVPISYLVTVKERIDSSETLGYKEQLSIVIDLKNQLKEIRSKQEIRELLLRLKGRDDLLAKVNAEIEALVKDIEHGAVPEPAEKLLTDGVERMESSREVLFCKNCGNKNGGGSKFCGNCGSGLSAAVEGLIREPEIEPKETSGYQTPEPAESPDTQRRTFICSAERAQSLIMETEKWLEAQGYECQKIHTEEGALLLQVTKVGAWKKLIGMATSLNVVFYQKGDSLVIEIGAGKWIDKAVAGTVSLFVLWPLAVTAGIGAWQQIKMPEKVYDFIDAYLRKSVVNNH
ncbi:TIR domain-containing protein [Teredinibacter haidensis]|uniref:TIR domain-containing protein n=1 Tax=Teredinibacter haidensis TaxID=2731755 RepID=UPI0009490C76|nr:TIR domain-containing protein [Teredinibacter haidensis]